MSEWQPIETAPKNGSTFIGWSKYWDEPLTVAWSSRLGRFVSRWDGVEVIEAAGDSWADYKNPNPLSHWMPLPAPPQETQG